MKTTILAWLILLASCAKEGQIPPKDCGCLEFRATEYNDSGVITEVWVTKFGVVCGAEFGYYQSVIKTQPDIGVMICPPVKRYGKWVLLDCGGG